MTLDGVVVVAALGGVKGRVQFWFQLEQNIDSQLQVHGTLHHSNSCQRGAESLAHSEKGSSIVKISA